MRAPRLLDLFCGAGGAGMGYSRAGFDVTGIDNKLQPRYPFRFIQADALNPPVRLEDFDVIHASPPCQGYTTMSLRFPVARAAHPTLVSETRRLLRSAGKPYVIENVEGARAEMPNAAIMCGYSLGLPRLKRHRLFESNLLLMLPQCRCYRSGANFIGVYGEHPDGRLLNTRADGTEQRAASSLLEGQEAMGMDWADWRGTKEAIPPAYTEFIGAQLMDFLSAQDSSQGQI